MLLSALKREAVPSSSSLLSLPESIECAAYGTGGERGKKDGAVGGGIAFFAAAVRLPAEEY